MADADATDPSAPGLRKEVDRARRRHAWWLALAAATAGNAALAVALHGDDRTPMRIVVEPPPPPTFAPRFTFVVHEAAPAPAPSPPAAPAPAAPLAFADLGPCPAPHAARPAGALRQPPVADHQPIAGLATAPTDSRWIAAWTAEHVYVSRDGGVRWERVLDGAGTVVDASFDCHGRALALRTTAGLGIRDGARETWRPVPVLNLRGDPDEDGVVDFADDPRYRPTIAGGHRALAITGTSGEELDHAFAVVSEDIGLSWRTIDLGWYEGQVMTAAWTDDTLRVVVPWTDCMAEGLRLVTITPAGARTEEIPEYASSIALDGASLLASSYECPAAREPNDVSPRVCAWRRGGWKALAALPAAASDEGESYQIVDGPTDVVLANGAIHALDRRGVARARGRTWEPDWRPVTTDRAGRLWGLDADRALVRR